MLCRLLLLAAFALLPLATHAAEPTKFDEATREPFSDVAEKSLNGKSIEHDFVCGARCESCCWKMVES